MNAFYDSLLRVSVSFIVLIIIVRLIGKKQMGQLSIFTYITGIVIGSIAGDLAVHGDITLIEAITGMSLWGLFTILNEYITLKSPKLNTLFNNQPTIIVKKGQIIYDKLKKMRLTIDDLGMLLRTNSVFSITDVEYAILEPNGDLSILKKPDLETVTKKDLNIQTDAIQNLQTMLISDGKIVYHNLNELGLTEEWLFSELNKQNIKSEKTVLYAELQSNKTVYLQKK